jgi:DeoR/GlpR family transcriptional regulator of sugar metabolism
MGMNQRQEWILDRLRDNGRVEVATVAQQLDTSEVTVRRDLDLLAESGVLRRVHGGAVSLLLRGEELPFELRELEAGEAKLRIAELVGGLIRDGEAVIVDSGTGGLALARVLSGRRVTAVPLSLPAAATLSRGADVTVILPGGTLRTGEGALTGPITESALQSLRVDTAVITCCGLSPADGIMAHDVAEASVKRTAMVSAQRTILMAEAAKFSRSALAVVTPLTDVDLLVTDVEAPADAIDEIRRLGLTVQQA